MAQKPNHNFLSYFASISFVLSLIGYPIVGAASSYIDIPNRFLSIPFRAIVAGLSLMALVGYWGKLHLHRRDIKKEGIRYPQFWLCFWIFWGLYLIRLGVDSYFSEKEMRLEPWEFFGYAVGMCLIPAIALSIKDIEVIRNYTLYFITFGGALGLALILILYNFQGTYAEYDYLSMARVELTTVNAITISRLSVTVIILSLWLLLSLRRSLQYKLWIPLLAGIALGLYGLAAGASRGPTLSLLIVLPFIFYAVGVRGKWIKIIIGVCFLAAIIAYNINQLDVDNLMFTNRVGKATFEDDTREQLIADGLAVVMNNPLLGGGITALEFYPHNLILESFMIFGILSGVCFTFIQLYSIWASFKLVKLGHSHCWIWFLLTQHSINALVSGSLDSSSDLWVMIVICMSEMARFSYQQRTDIAPQFQNINVDALMIR